MRLRLFYIGGDPQFWYTPRPRDSALSPMDISSEAISATCTQHAHDATRCAWLRPTRPHVGLSLPEMWRRR
jgi:hypothetical protein